jgi:hypothetical protein
MDLYQYFMNCDSGSPMCQLSQMLWTGNPYGLNNILDMGFYTILSVILVVLSIRVFPVVYKYLNQFFSKRGV